MILAIDHVQLAMPPGGEAAARAFYADLLGLIEEAKPAALAVRGGCWFGAGTVKLHLGVEEDFRPARKAHPALVVDELAPLTARLRAAGYTVHDDDALNDVQRAFTEDPFGNRIELIGAGPGGR